MMDSRPGTLGPASESKLGQLMRSFDWATTPLGPVEEWAPELKSAAAFVLESPIPAALIAGPQFLTIHNDAFRPILGDKPEAMGRPFADVWSEAWDEIGPMADRALGGEAACIEDYSVMVDHSGQAEQAYFTFCCSPVRDADGTVIGFVHTAIETSAAVLAQRRLADELSDTQQLYRISSSLIVEDDVDALYDRFLEAARVFMRAQMASIQRLDAERQELLLLAEHGFAPESAKFWERVPAGGTTSCGAALSTGEPVIVSDAEAWDLVAGTDDLEHYRLSGIRSMLSMPLVSREGRPVGVISTHWREIHEPSERELRLLQVLGRQAADLIERRSAQDARKATEGALHDTEERFRKFGEASQDVLWMRDAHTLQWTYLTPAFEAIYGLSREEALAGDNYRNWLDLIVPEDVDQVRSQVQRLRDGESVEFEYRIRRHTDGKVRWLRDTDFPIRDTAGKIALFGGIAEDITAEKADQDRMKLLVAELQHRVRNVLAMIRSIIRRTSSTKSDVTEFVQHLEGRIEAMARTQALLTRSPGQGVDLEDLVRDEMLAQAASPGKFALSGPSVSLPPKAAEVLTLAVHELATNSVKYGVLGQSDGRVAASWRSVHLAADHVLKFTWRETGLVLDGDRDRRRGFGTELITRRVPYELNGKGDLSFEKGALTATIEFPVEAGYSILETDPARWMRGAL